jgi:plastocyanin
MKSLRPGLLWLLGGAVACGGGGSGPGPTPSSVTATAGENQVGAAGQQLGAALEVIVKDGQGNPMANITVSWAVGAGGGSVAPGSNQTGADGKATATRTLGPGAGAQTATATVSGLTPATFHHVAQIQGATQIQASGSTTRNSDTVKATAAPLVVLVADQNSLPKQGVIVTWTITAGGGVLSQDVDTTDASGFSSVSWTFNSVSGSKTVQASVTGLVGSPVTFTATVGAGQVTDMTLNGGNSQAGPVSTALPTPHSVILHDAYGNPGSGVTVAWVLGLGGGSLSSATPVANSLGVASITRTLGPAVGVSSDTAKFLGFAIAFTDTAAASSTVRVGGASNVFQPVNDTVSVGTFVKFTWQGGFHDVTWDSGPVALTSSPTQTTGTLVVRPPQPGIYAYHCTQHGSPGAGMHGVIVVQ